MLTIIARYASVRNIGSIGVATVGDHVWWDAVVSPPHVKFRAYTYVHGGSGGLSKEFKNEDNACPSRVFNSLSAILCLPATAQDTWPD